MAKLYLVRRNLETFLGPMTLEELKKSYQRMDFGLQDEVGGSYGNWVAFDDLEKINKNYPELTQVVRETMLGGWGFSQNMATKIIDKKQSHKSKSGGSRKSSGSSGISFALTLILVLTAVGFSAYYVARHTKMGNKFFNITKSDPATKFEKLLRGGERSSFINSFKSKLPAVLNDARKSNENLNRWLPSLRAYAFLTKGGIDGVPSKILKGQVEGMSPNKCSLDFWKKQWNLSKPALADVVKKFPSSQRLTPWQQVLAWDPYWIARRSEEDQWIYPQNYHHACVIMAEKAFSDVFANPETSGVEPSFVKAVEGRLRQLSSIIETGMAANAGITSEGDEIEDEGEVSFIASLGCLDSVDAISDTADCFNDEDISDSWKKYMKNREHITAMRIQFHQFATAITKKDLENVAKLASSINRSDSITGFRYQAETRYVRNLLRNNGDVTRSINELKYQHQNVNFLIGH